MVRRLAAVILLATLVAACSSGGGTTAPSASATEPAATATNATPSAAASSGDLQLVAVGDSILYNSPDDCPGCTSAVDRYAEAVTAATGKSVSVRNLSEHTGLQVAGLLRELDSDRTRMDALATADLIIVGVAHNDVPMNRDDDSCDGFGGDSPNWSKFTADCIAREVATYTPKYQTVYEQIAKLRAGKPTILRTINRYNDWIGWPGHEPPAEGIAATSAVVAAWNDMICGAAEANGFVCADISVKFNGEDGTEPANDLLAADYTHPSQKGNDVIAQVLIEVGFAPLGP